MGQCRVDARKWRADVAVHVHDDGKSPVCKAASITIGVDRNHIRLGAKPGDDAIKNDLAMDTFKRLFPPHPRGSAPSDDDGATPHACA